MGAIWYSVNAIRGDLLYMGTAGLDWGGIFLGYYAFNRHTGEVVWQRHKDGILFNDNFEDIWNYFWRNIDILDFLAPVVWRNFVIFAGGDHAARAFDANTGELRWEHVFDTPVSSAPTLAGGRIYFGLMGDDNNPPRLVCLSARDGRLLWEMETEGSILSAPVIAGRRVIFGTDKSVFYVLEQVF